MPGVPGLIGNDHIGITVPDLTIAHNFLCDVLGASFVFDGGVIEDQRVLTDVLNTTVTNTCRYSFYRLGTGLNLEVFEYKDKTGEMPCNSQIGGHHIAIYVKNIEAAHKYFVGNGVAVSGEPELIQDGPAAGSSWFYFKAPWGLQMECVSYPHGKKYELSGGVKLWSPRAPNE